MLLQTGNYCLFGPHPHNLSLQICHLDVPSPCRLVAVAAYWMSRGGCNRHFAVAWPQRIEKQLKSSSSWLHKEETASLAPPAQPRRLRSRAVSCMSSGMSWVSSWSLVTRMWCGFARGWGPLTVGSFLFAKAGLGIALQTNTMAAERPSTSLPSSPGWLQRLTVVKNTNCNLMVIGP